MRQHHSHPLTSRSVCKIGQIKLVLTFVLEHNPKAVALFDQLVNLQGLIVSFAPKKTLPQDSNDSNFMSRCGTNLVRK